MALGGAVGVVGAEALAGKGGLDGGVEAGGQGVGVGVAPCGVGAPAGGVAPAVTAAALGQGDVPFLRDEEFGIEAEGEEAVHDAGGDEPVSGVFPEPPIRRALARCLDAVAVVDEDFHSWFCV